MLVCPKCGNAGTFAGTTDRNDIWVGDVLKGTRVCPNPACYLVIEIFHDGNELLDTYPARRIDFDASDVPQRIVAALTEAIDCHAHGNHVAAAIMVRRTMEEICEDKEAKGDNLKKRIADLGTRIVIPGELIGGMDDLRLLGNDAAHIEARAYQNIGSRELEVAIKFAKEIIKATYQYSTLLNELRALRQSNEQAGGDGTDSGM